LFTSVPYGTGAYKLSKRALEQWRQLGALHFNMLATDTYLKPEIQQDTSEPVPIEMEFIDGIYLCYGQSIVVDGFRYLHGCGRRIYRGVYGSIQEGQF